MIGVVEHSLEDTLPKRSMGEGVGKAFLSLKTLLSIPQTITPVLHHSNNRRI